MECFWKSPMKGYPLAWNSKCVFTVIIMASPSDSANGYGWSVAIPPVSPPNSAASTINTRATFRFCFIKCIMRRESGRLSASQHGWRLNDSENSISSTISTELIQNNIANYHGLVLHSLCNVRVYIAKQFLPTTLFISALISNYFRRPLPLYRFCSTSMRLILFVEILILVEQGNGVWVMLMPSFLTKYNYYWWVW